MQIGLKQLEWSHFKEEMGFTLIEVMVVVAIIGILASVAVPQYQGYIARSRVVEGINLASSARLAVAEVFANLGPVNMHENTLEIFSFKPTKSVLDITIAESGVVMIQYQNSVAQDDKNILLYLPTNEPDANHPRLIDLSKSGGLGWSGHWTCRSAGTDLDQNLLPQECRSASK